MQELWARQCFKTGRKIATILVTGGAGFIGSHTCVELLDAGYEIAVVDNFCNSKPETLDKIKQITGKDFKFYEADLLCRDKVEKIFEENKIDAVIHFAGLKAELGIAEMCADSWNFTQKSH